MSHFTEWLFHVAVFLNVAESKKFFAIHVAFGPKKSSTTPVKNSAAKNATFCNTIIFLIFIHPYSQY